MVSFQWQGSCLFFSWRAWLRGFQQHSCHRRRSCGRCSCHCHSHLLRCVPVEVRLFPAWLHSAKTPLLTPVNLKTPICHIPARPERSHNIWDLFWGIWGKTYLSYFNQEWTYAISFTQGICITYHKTLASPKHISIHAHNIVWSLTINKNTN